MSESPSSTSDDHVDQAPDFRHLQRLAMVGTLATGLGHDLRNLVMPILLRLDVLAASHDLPEGARADLAGIRRSITDLQRLAGGLRLLGSDPFQPRGEAQVTRLADWWQELRPVIADALPSGTTIAAEVPADLPAVSIPPTVLAQVVINLVMNARRAMEGLTAPRLEVVIAREVEQLCMHVSDNGQGMDDEVRARCFEPYFTTRPREYATGLGLATARALMRRYRGDLTLASSTPGHGATFALRLPIDAAASSGTRRTARARILLSDPRQQVMVRRMLTQQGVQESGTTDREAADIIVCDATTIPNLATLHVTWAADRPPRVIALGVAPDDAPSDGRIHWVYPGDTSRLRDLLR
ncbi:MAG: HAMP domain-containing sensor histidine kinase [Gemmatimonadaceae bacterium]